MGFSDLDSSSPLRRGPEPQTQKTPPRQANSRLVDVAICMHELAVARSLVLRVFVGITSVCVCIYIRVCVCVCLV